MAALQQLLKVDELVISDHHYLDLNDACYYYMEYTARAGYKHSDANNLIQNLKKPVDRKGKAEYRYKEKAIIEIGQMFAKTLEVHMPGWTIVPIPPSKTKKNASYDDRMLQCVEKYCNGRGDIRELLVLNKDMNSSHGSDVRPSVQEIMANLSIDEKLCKGVAGNIALFDDVLTTGAHFKAAKNILLQRFPNARIVGIFVARRSFPASLYSDFSDLQLPDDLL